MKNINVTLVIPSLNPDEKLISTVNDAINAGFSDVILIDDGSAAEHKKYFSELSLRPEVTLLTHEVNLGKGAALKTAFAYFIENRPEKSGVITADGDGQHRTVDIVACAEELEANKDSIILGCRDFSLPHVPKRSRFGNRSTSLVFRLFCGMKLSDTQTGLRAIPRNLVPVISEAKGTRYEYETNMLLLMGSLSIPYREVKIETVYFDNNEKSHFRPIRDSLRVYSLIIKYALSSVLSSLVDLLFFFIFGLFIVTGNASLDVFAATAAARVVSVIFNFALNKRLVFENKGSVGKTLFRYVCLALPIMLFSGLFVYILSDAVGVGSSFLRTLLKIPVDVVLFLISFRAQRAWVFNDKK